MPLLTLSVNGFWKKIYRRQGEALCLSALEQARTPHFYAIWGVPDTVEGRYDCAVLHMCLLMRHLKGHTAQAAFDSFFAYTELTLREMGVGDLKVGRQVKQCATFFYGALQAYEDGLDGTASLEEAILRNLYGECNCVSLREVLDYVRSCDAHLKGQDLRERIEWPNDLLNL